MKRKLLFIALNFFLFQSNAQLDFYQHPIMSSDLSVAESSIVLLVDVDGDTDLDVISSSYYGQKIGWQENLDGVGTYGNLKLITNNAKQVKSLFFEDINGDGIKDLISASDEDGKIAWYENDGQGSFGTQNILIQYAAHAYSVFASDIDNDGDIDIVASLENKLTLFKNNDGQGNFAPPIDIAYIAISTSLHIADMDGDGDMDIVTNSAVEDNYIKIIWLKNLNGQGNFGPPQVLHTLIPELNYSAVSNVYTSDIDGDGDNDIIYTANYQMGWIENTNGAGTFNSASVQVDSQPYNRNRFTSLTCTDMDNDGDLDIVTGATEWQTPSKIRWYKNSDGIGNFTTNHTIALRSWNNLYIATGDIDNDGDIDAVTSSNGDYDNVVWFANDGNNQLFNGPKLISRFFYSPKESRSIDLDNDGDLDIINISNNKQLLLYENLDGLGNLDNQKVLATSIDGRLQFSDINGDGKVDILTSYGGSLKCFKNEGSLNFVELVIDPANAYAPSPYPADIDGDGDIDLISIKYGTGTRSYLTYHENLDGLGNFGSPQTILNLPNYKILEIRIVDLDGDNDMDITFVSTDGSYSGKVGWLKNLDGLGTFSTVTTIQNTLANSIDVGDLDGDGDVDIIMSKHSPSLLSWYENTNGLGSFSSQKVIVSRTEYNGFTEINVSDLDGDGDLDVIASSENGFNLEWFENTNGLADTFTQKNIAKGISSINSFWPGDINGDGKLDIVISANYGTHPVAWFSNSGLLSNRLNGQVILDIDNNGCGGPPDIKLANLRIETSNGSETVSTFTNNNGYYQMFPTQQGTYTTTIQSNINYYNSVPNTIESIFTGFGNIELANFCFSANQNIKDLKISIIALTPARPGFTCQYAIHYQNIGTVTQNGSVMFNFDNNKLNFINSNPIAGSQTNNQLTYNFTDLKPFESRSIMVRFTAMAPPIVNLGDILNFTATINPVIDDVTIIDNTILFNQVVIGSYDPNDIMVKEGSEINIDDVDNFLHYVIRFQNTGTASAINVQVENTLDPNLDWSTIEPEYIKHNCNIEILNGNKVKFIFPNINLPDSISNPINSQGFISYKIKPKNTSSVGDIFHNSAEIYFDYNPAIYTNTVATEVVNNTLSTNDFYPEQQYIYPNPTNGKINIKSNNSIKSIEVYNNLGQLIISNTDENSIDVSHFNNGLYYIKFADQTGSTFLRKVLKN